MVISEKTRIFQGFRGGPTFSWEGGGSNFFQGVQMLISKETHITCDFPGGGGGSRPPILPLDPYMKDTQSPLCSLHTCNKVNLLSLACENDSATLSMFS